MKPVRLPAAATNPLPRWSILALCLLYILPGLIGRDPWKGENDAASFGIMWTMAHGNLSDWLWPHIVGMPMPEEGPLAFWFGALCIKLFGWLLGDPMAARISTGLFFILGAVSVWYTTYILGRRAEAQPLKLAFGGQPEPRDFGRTLADGALLIYLGCLGLLVRSHETSAETLHVSLIAFTLYHCARFFDMPSKRTATKLGLVLGLLILTRGWVLPIALFISLIAVCVYRGQKQHIIQLSLALPFAGILAGSWLLAITLLRPFDSSPYEAWMLWNYRQIGFPSAASISYFLRYSFWFAWPAWPFAAWAVYAWRKQERALHISLPVTFILCFVLLALINNFSEEGILLPILPPLAILAAFGLPTMKRSAINAVDWFSVIVLTGVATLTWLVWMIGQIGLPPALANKVLSWAPGYQAQFNALTFIVAVTASIFWIRLVYWRISRQPSALLRAVVLSSGGVILCWLLLMTLWLPLINHRVSYAPVATQIKENLSTLYRCIDSNVGPSQRASFAYFGGIHFAGFSEQDCDVLLVQSNRRSPTKANDLAEQRSNGKWELMWEGHRAYDKDELFSLYRKK
jgi:4-amino-4-deoxy-L-arabinose transferase-like glycosyltransferase